MTDLATLEIPVQHDALYGAYHLDPHCATLRTWRGTDVLETVTVTVVEAAPTACRSCFKSAGDLHRTIRDTPVPAHPSALVEAELDRRNENALTTQIVTLLQSHPHQRVQVGRQRTIVAHVPALLAEQLARYARSTHSDDRWAYRSHPLEGDSAALAETALCLWKDNHDQDGDLQGVHGALEAARLLT